MTFRIGPDGRIFTDDERDVLTPAEMLAFLTRGTRRKSRRTVTVQELFPSLSKTGVITCELEDSFPTRDAFIVRVEATRDENGYRISCEGQLEPWTIARINHFLGRPYKPATRPTKTEPWTRNKKIRQIYTPKPAPVQEKKPRKRHFVGAPLTLPHNVLDNSVVRQFKHKETTWRQMLDAVVYVFKLEGNGQSSSKELAARAIWRSYENSGKRFVQMKRAGFTLRFDLVDGIWRGDLTRLTIASSKCNKSIYYRRMRAFFGEKFHEPESARQMRRKRRHAHMWRLLYPPLRA